VSAGSDGVDRARAEYCVSGAQNEVPICVCACQRSLWLQSLLIQDFQKSTVEYFDIIGALFADNGKGEYPGLLRTGYVLYSFIYTMGCYVERSLKTSL
jgi:hypothetical protein